MRYLRFGQKHPRRLPKPEVRATLNLLRDEVFARSAGLSKRLFFLYSIRTPPGVAVDVLDHTTARSGYGFTALRQLSPVESSSPVSLPGDTRCLRCPTSGNSGRRQRGDSRGPRHLAPGGRSTGHPDYCIPRHYRGKAVGREVSAVGIVLSAEKRCPILASRLGSPGSGGQDNPPQRAR
jgi:hypothetical protein